MAPILRIFLQTALDPIWAARVLIRPLFYLILYLWEQRLPPRWGEAALRLPATPQPASLRGEQAGCVPGQQAASAA